MAVAVRLTNQGVSWTAPLENCFEIGKRHTSLKVSNQKVVRHYPGGCGMLRKMTYIIDAQQPLAQKPVYVSHFLS